MSNFEITDLGKFLEEQSETIIEDNHEVSEDEHDMEEEDVLLPKDHEGEESSEYEGDMSEECETFCLQCMRMYTNVHLWHLQTSSYAEHEALEDYYEDLFELTDTFIETAIANDGGMSCETSYNLELIPYCEMMNEVEAFKELIETHKESVTEESMVNVMDDMLTVTDEVLYKLKNLK